MTQKEQDYLRNGKWILIGSILFGYTADYAFNLVLGQTLNSHDYGDYKVAYAFVSLSAILVLLGGDRVAPRLLASHIQKGHAGIVWHFFRFYGVLALGLSVLILVVTSLISYWHIGVSGSENHHPLVMMSLVIPIIAMGALFSRILQSAKLLAMANLPWRVALPTAKICLLLLLFYYYSSLSLWQVIAVGALVAMVIVVWQGVKVLQLNLLSFNHDSSDFNRSQSLRLSIPMMFAMLVTIALNQMDLFMLEILGKESEVGYFAAASTIAHIIPVAQTTIIALFLPLIQPAFDQGKSEARHLFRSAQTRIFLVVLTILLLLLGTSHWLLSLFGEGYQAAEEALILLVFAQSTWALVALCSTWVQYLGYGGRVMLVVGSALAIDLLLNWLLIPSYGINGAAIATLCSLLIASIAMAYVFFQVRKR